MPCSQTPSTTSDGAEKNLHLRLQAAGIDSSKLKIGLEGEFSFSTHAVLVWVSTWASGCMLEGWGSDANIITVRCLTLLRVLVQACLQSTGRYVAKVNGVVLTIDDRKLDAQTLKEAFPVLQRKIANAELLGQLGVHHLLVLCANTIMKDYTNAEEVDTVSRTLHDLICFLALTWECECQAPTAYMLQSRFGRAGVGNGPVGTRVRSICMHSVAGSFLALQCPS